MSLAQEPFYWTECNMNSKAKQAKKKQVAEIQGKFRQGHAWYVICPLCGKPVSVRESNLDHIIALSQGGHPTDIRNLQLTHKKCNSEKGNALPSECGGQNVERPGLRWGEVLQMPEAPRQY